MYQARLLAGLHAARHAPPPVEDRGHEGFYAQNMYTPMELDDAEYRLKPMNCPGHILIYGIDAEELSRLPVRLGELGNVYRYERSGTMHGLLRVRGFTQDDAHISVRRNRLRMKSSRALIRGSCAENFGFTEYKVGALHLGRESRNLTRAATKIGPRQSAHWSTPAAK